jgi:hypothetical protein
MNRRNFLQGAVALAAAAALPRISWADLRLRDKKRLGGGVHYDRAWVDYFCNQNFQEVGTYPANHPFGSYYPWETGPIDYRLRFTPAEPCVALLRSSLRVRVGDLSGANGYLRLIGKCQIVRVAPTFKVLAHYEEGGLELKDTTAWGATAPLLRFVDPNFNPYCYDEITAEEGLIGQEHAYAVQMFGVDGRQLHALFGAPFTLIA